MLSSQTTKRLDVPGHPGEWITIRKLGWRALSDARDAQTRAAYQHVKELGSSAVDALRAVTVEQVVAQKLALTAQYDAGTLLRAAIVGWSLSDGTPTPEEIDQLPEDVAIWLVGEILALSKPPRDEATVKNA